MKLNILLMYDLMKSHVHAIKEVKKRLGLAMNKIAGTVKKIMKKITMTNAVE